MEPQPSRCASYLRGRVAQVFDAKNARRPRWTVQDAHAVQELLRRGGFGNESAGEIGERDLEEREPYDAPQHRVWDDEL